ncbi:MAG: hypothetical protein HZB16_23445 [Armatimonadetes bacterium]|nr:hypothetical protein [Armatimonadota bacterium]
MRRWLVIIAALAVAASLRPVPRPRRAMPDAPPGVSLAATALGGFNGVAASYVWLYASRREEAGQPFELVRAARWVSALQPNLGSLYDFQAWNLATNVADTFGSPPERWPWVEAGLNLLYDEGLARRGDDPRLPGALASLLLGRVCGGQDDAAEYFRQAFAARWTPIVGPPPTRWPAVAGLERWRMEARSCAEIDSRFGPLDWRTGWAHALYWARRGALASPSRRQSRPLWSWQIEALRGACLDGRIITAPGQGVFVTVPMPELAVKVEALYDEALARLPRDQGLRAGRQAWRDEAALMLVAYGLSSDESAAERTVAALTDGDAGMAQSVADSYALRALLCGRLGDAAAARGLTGMAQRVARSAGLDWSAVQRRAGEALGR